MKNALAAGLVWTALILAGCAAATDTKNTSNTATADLPTVAALTGTWKNTNTYTSTGTNAYTAVTTTTYTLTATTFLKQEVYVNTPVTGTPSTNYSDTKGTYAVSGDQSTLTVTDRRSSNTAFADAAAGWTPISPAQVLTGTLVLSGGKLYGIGTSVFKALGSVNGLVGVWAGDSYDSRSSKPYSRNSLTFTSDTVVQASYQSLTPTFAATPDGSKTYGFKENGNGTYTISTAATATTPATTQIINYFIAGNYQILSGYPDLGAYTKQ